MTQQERWAANTARYHARHPERARACANRANRAYVLRKRFGISLAEYNVLLKKQKGRCAICGHKPHGKDMRRRGKALATDHNHRTNAVRGLLCDKCNRGIGLFKDSIRLLLAAVAYLRKYDN